MIGPTSGARVFSLDAARGAARAAATSTQKIWRTGNGPPVNFATFCRATEKQRDLPKGSISIQPEKRWCLSFQNALETFGGNDNLDFSQLIFLKVVHNYAFVVSPQVIFSSKQTGSAARLNEPFAHALMRCVKDKKRAIGGDQDTGLVWLEDEI